MRPSFVPLAFLCLVLGAHADQETWLKTEEPENASFFAPELRYSTLDGNPVFWPGVRIGWIIGSVISFGFEGYMLAGEPAADGPGTARFNMAVGGMVLEAIPSPERRTHLVFNLLIGAGGAQAGGDANLDTLSDHGFFALEPGVGLEFNLTRNIRISPGVSYLWISGDVPGMDSKWKVSETAFNLTLRFKEPDG